MDSQNHYSHNRPVKVSRPTTSLAPPHSPLHHVLECPISTCFEFCGTRGHKFVLCPLDQCWDPLQCSCSGSCQNWGLEHDLQHDLSNICGLCWFLRRTVQQSSPCCCPPAQGISCHALLGSESCSPSRGSYHSLKLGLALIPHTLFYPVSLIQTSAIWDTSVPCLQAVGRGSLIRHWWQTVITQIAALIQCNNANTL